MDSFTATPATRQLSGCRVLVTGSSGFLGSHVCARLLALGADVRASSRRQKPRDPRASRKRTSVRSVQTDLEDIKSVQRMLGSLKPDVILHFSGHVTAAPDLAAVRPTFDSLLSSTVNILTAAAELGCCRRIVIPGSLTEPPPGESDAAPTSPYAAAKWASSAYARMFHALYRLPVVIVRAAMTYGPGQPRHRLLPYVILSVLSDAPPRLTDGRLEADWTYVDDMVEGILAAASAPDVDGLTIDLGTGRTTSAREIVDLTLELMETPLRAEYGALPSRPNERVRAADVSLARERLGWTASTSLREGLQRTIAWFRAQEGSVQPDLAVPLPVPAVKSQQSAGEEIVGGTAHVTEPNVAPLGDVQQGVRAV